MLLHCFFVEFSCSGGGGGGGDDDDDVLSYRQFAPLFSALSRTT
jgi:hypothetical protein